jgi:negative regulator of sigma-B (phosphoserine phosphatase)
MDAMSQLTPREHAVLSWGVAGASLEGDTSGDQHAVIPFAGGVLVAVVDGLGHGPEAALAARAACAMLEESPGDPVKLLIERCHENIRHTRGVVMSLASFDSRTSSMTWTGIGNVEGALLRVNRTGQAGREAILNRGGVVGYRLPSIHVGTVLVEVGDLLIMATDGISHGFTDAVERDEPDPDAITAAVMAGYYKGTDDGLVLAARYLGGAP